MARLTHFDAEGKAAMVDVSAKDETERIATAEFDILAPDCGTFISRMWAW